jgi:hypothetical protein
MSKRSLGFIVTSSTSAWVPIASSVQGFVHRPLTDACTLEAMRTQALFIVSACLQLKIFDTSK